MPILSSRFERYKTEKTKRQSERMSRGGKDNGDYVVSSSRHFHHRRDALHVRERLRDDDGATDEQYGGLLQGLSGRVLLLLRTPLDRDQWPACHASRWEDRPHLQSAGRTQLRPRKVQRRPTLITTVSAMASSLINESLHERGNKQYACSSRSFFIRGVSSIRLADVLLIQILDKVPRP